MKTKILMIGMSVLSLGGCVSESTKPWIERADSFVGKNLRTERDMVVVESYGRTLLVLKEESKRYTRPPEHQHVIAEIPAGSKVSVKRRTFRVSKPGRSDYLVIDVSAPQSTYSDILLVIGGIHLAEGNFS